MAWNILAVADYYQTCALPKGEPRKRRKGREKRQKVKGHAAVRQYVFGRERDVCRCCRIRNAESMHEIVSRGRRGKVSRTNSIAVCGVIVGAVPSCHTYLQQSQILVQFDKGLGAESRLTFTPLSVNAAEWMRVRVGEAIESDPMQRIEEEF